MIGWPKLNQLDRQATEKVPAPIQFAVTAINTGQFLLFLEQRKKNLGMRSVPSDTSAPRLLNHTKSA